jgi:hypothetical protein
MKVLLGIYGATATVSMIRYPSRKHLGVCQRDRYSLRGLGAKSWKPPCNMQQLEAIFSRLNDVSGDLAAQADGIGRVVFG